MTEERMHCPGAETIAAFAEGKLERRRVPEVLAHIESCEDCMTAIGLIEDEIRETHQPAKGLSWWLPMAAALAAVALGSLLWLRPWRSPIDRLIAASPKSARVVEPRLAGGFGWAAYRGPLRSGDGQSDPQRLRLSGVAADAIERGNRDHSPEAQHAAGVALLLIGDDLDAVSRLRAAADAAPSNAKRWSDLAAAEYAAAVRLERASLFPEALGHADHALRVDPKLPEALFNRALALERLGLVEQARAGWNEYLAVDGSSPWAAEARGHLAKLPSRSNAALFNVEQALLERAAASGDTTTVTRLVDRYRERARTFGEAEYLGRWAEAVEGGRPEEATRWLTISRAIGDALVRLSGESLLRDAVRAIDAHVAAGFSRPAEAGRYMLAEAHIAYRRGRIAFSKGKPTDAEPDLRRAAQQFAAADDPLALVARFYAANTRFERQDLAGAREDLDALAAELRERPGYIAAAANVQWELSLCRTAEGDWTGTVASLSDAAARFERLGETSNLASIESLRAYALDVLGRPDDAWRARIRSLSMEARERRGDRLAGALATASMALIHTGSNDAARALLAIEEQAERDLHSDGMLVHALTQEARLSAAMGDDDDARAAAREAMTVAARLADPVLRARETAVAQLAAGAAELPRNARRARELLSSAMAGFTSDSLLPRVADAALLRARANLSIGDAAAAGRDLDRGIAALDRLRVPVAGGAAPAVFDAGDGLFAEAVRLHLDRGDVAAAFGYAERSRAQLDAGAISLDELRRRLSGSGAAVIESFVAGSEVILFAVSERDVVTARRPIPADDEAALYDALIRPCEEVVRRARRLIIVPDPRFAAVPYAALSDGTRRLVERLPVALAPSASSLDRAEEPAPRSIVAMALPADQALPLPESEREVAEVARLYPSGSVVAASPAALRDARADVLHLAGHTQRDRSDDAALVFAGGQRLAWSAVAAMRLRARVVTLSACETLRDPARSGGRALSLGEGFLAAGARDVVGTLVPVTDADARALFHDIHRRLAAGVEPSEAVRLAQLDDLGAGGSAWRALAVATTRIAD